MISSHHRNTLIIAGLAATLGIGVAGCSESAEDRAAEDPGTPTVAAAAKATGEAAMATGDAAAQAVSDTWITTKVKSVLHADTDANGLDVHVETRDGVVTLRGDLTSQADVDRVEALARDVEGVTRVDATALTVARR